MRLIASVQILGSERAIKTVQFEENRYLGDPLNIIRILNAKGAQEIAVFDLNASRSKQIDYEEIARLSSEVSVPFLYGGGLSPTTDIRKLARLGVERFILSRFLLGDELLVSKLVEQLGSSSVSISLDIERIEVIDDLIQVVLRSYPGRTFTIHQVLDTVERLQVGELVVRSVTLDGGDGNSSINFYQELFQAGAFDNLRKQSRLLIGSGIRTLEIAHSLMSKIKLDGFVVGSMVSLTKTGGILTSYPREYSILN